MKKTLLALSVLLASTAANAGVEVYNNDGATVNIGGDLEVVYLKGTADNSHVQQEIQDADIKFDVRYAVSDELSVGGYWEFQGDDGGTTQSGSSNMGDVYFAFYTASAGSFKVGDLCSIGDDLGLGNDFQFGTTTTVEQADVCGDETVRWDYSSDMFYVSAAYRDDQRSDDTKADLFDMKAGVTMAGFDLMGYYGTSNKADQDTFALEASYAFAAANVGLAYYDVEDTANTVAITADYTIQKVTLSAGVDWVDVEVGVTDSDGVVILDSTNYFVNAGYAIAPATTLYAEIGGNDLDDSEVGYAVGAKVEF
ncbi:porin [Vibrio sp. DW001]|uniref:porin n=1 Tax=Vibrio sp. DW001 TaxID=2912315 RepID=UPI0023AEC998|nr:porin [Vibrio sp. DW001]WED25583.1 porin [Vibrio sp. DW001]